MTTLINFISAEAARLKQAGVSFGHGTANAFDEAAWLVLWSLGSDLDALEGQVARVLTDDETAAASALVTKRIETRLPAAYLTKEAWLQNVPFHIDERSIVPRSLIAELLADGEEQGLLDTWLTPETRSVLDLCTGNGSLAVIAAMAFPDVKVVAADISEEALALARMNVDRHKLGKRITLMTSDLLADVGGPYDLIICNPPYVNAQSMAALPPEYLHEPAMALAGGEDGMDFIRRIIHDAPAKLNKGGVLLLEVGNERAHFEHAFRRLEVVWVETSAGNDQVLVATREALQRWTARA